MAAGKWDADTSRCTAGSGGILGSDRADVADTASAQRSERYRASSLALKFPVALIRSQVQRGQQRGHALRLSCSAAMLNVAPSAIRGLKALPVLPSADSAAKRSWTIQQNCASS